MAPLAKFLYVATSRKATREKWCGVRHTHQNIDAQVFEKRSYFFHINSTPPRGVDILPKVSPGLYHMLLCYYLQFYVTSFF